MATSVPTAFDEAWHGCSGNGGGAAWWLTADSYRERLAWVQVASDRLHSGYPAYATHEALYKFLLIVIEGVCVSDGTASDCACGRVHWSNATKKRPTWLHISDGVKGLEGNDDHCTAVFGLRQRERVQL